MAPPKQSNLLMTFLIPILIIIALSFQIHHSSATIAPPRRLAVVQDPVTILKYHNGPLLKGQITVNLIWYGKFTPIQRSTITDFIQSLSPRSTQPKPSVSTWWNIISHYKNGPTTVTLGKQYTDNRYSLGKILKQSQISSLANKLPHRNAINIILTSSDVVPEGFCMSACGAHMSGLGGKHKKSQYTYAWIGNPAVQCPGQCAWPFATPMFGAGPQSPPLVSPNKDVGVDGMIINLATVLAGTVTNPYMTGYYQGVRGAGLEAVSACTGIYGSGAFPGYPGHLLVDKKTGASFNAFGVQGRKYLLPAMWDPATSTCKTLV